MPSVSSYARPEYGSSTYLDSMGRASDYESAYAPVTYNTSTNAGSRLDLNNGSPLDSPAKYGEDRVNSVLRKYPKYSSGPDYGGSGALPASATSYGLAPSASSSALAKSRSYSNFDSLKRTDFSSLNTQLGTLGLTLKQIPGDGNCLFRALGDQLFGDSNDHLIHRTQVVTYMRQHRDDFEPFVEDDLSFDAHLSSLAENGTFAGNDSIVAFARKHNLTVVIHQLNKPLWQIHGGMCVHTPSAPESHHIIQVPEAPPGRARSTSATTMVTTTTVCGRSGTRAILLPNCGCVCPLLV